MTNPRLLTIPFADTGTKNEIPVSGAIEPQLATFQAGFPVVTQQKIADGGIPPERADFNGILNIYGQHIVHLNKGMPYEFDQDFANAIGGYPLHARIMLSDGQIAQNTIDGNISNPNLAGTGWLIGISASLVKNANGETQQKINDYIGVNWYAKAGGYALGDRVRLLTGEIVQSTVESNTNNPNVDMTGWELGTLASGIKDESGKTQQEINNTLSFLKTPEFYGAKGDGTTVDNASFLALAAKTPDSIDLKAGSTYLIDSSSTVNFTESCIINGNGATIIMDQRWNIQKTAMWGSQLSEAATKGQTVLKMAFMTNFVVGSEILVFQNLGLSGSDIDPYFQSVADDADNGEYSSHINYVTAVDITNKTITLAIPLRFNAPIQTAIYVVDKKKLTFVNTNFILRGDANGFRMIDNCSNIEFIGGSLVQPDNEDNNVNLRINTCKDVVFAGVKQKGVNLSIEYGSYNCGVRAGQGASYGYGDAMVMIWCASTRCYSEQNNFTPSQKMRAGSITAGVYLGAKTRDCWSTDDNVDGLPYGFRAQWGAVNPTFTRPVYKNPNGTYSLFSDYSHNVQVVDGKLYDKALRTVGVHRLTLKDTLLDSGWRGEAVEIPLMLDLNRGNDTAMIREDYTISGNTVIGAARSWLALSKSTFTNNNMTSLRFVNAGVMKDTYFNGNTFGNFYSQFTVNCGFINNTIDNSYLQSGTLAGSEVAAVHFYSQTVVNMAGNTITHPTCGVKRTFATSQVNSITESNNNIISPVQWDTGVNDSTAPTISSGASLLSRGLEYKSNVAGSKVVWRYNGASWVKGFSTYPQLTYSQGSFPNTASGLTTFATTRTISGAAVGDAVLVSTTSTDIGEVKGRYFARVTAADTITVYYQDRSGVSETVAAVNITLTLAKS